MTSQVTGYDNRTNKLHLFDVETVDESMVEDGISFDKTDIRKNLTLFLYPDDSDRAGQILRIYQQYFMVSNAARLILSEAAAKGSTLYDLPDYAVIQINDTHPTMVIPGADSPSHHRARHGNGRRHTGGDGYLRLYQPHHPGGSPGNLAHGLL